jgi:nitroreductase
VDHFGKEGFLVGLTSIFWRESWKYGERAFRYCNHDVGHALACLSFSANLQGWNVTYLNAVSDAEIETLLGMDRTRWQEMEAEHPDLLCIVHPGPEADVRRSLSPGIVDGFSELRFEGVPNTLSRERVHWEIIYKTAALVRKPETAERTFSCPERPFYTGATPSFSAAEIIRKRRSAVAYDGQASLTKAQVFTILDRTLPRRGCAPFDAGLGDPCVHLLIFLHAVEGLDPGLYFFLRDEAAFRQIRDASDPGFLWQTVEPGLPLYLLRKGNVRGHATLVSCEQDIAGSSAFSLGMIARFREVMEREPYRYRHLFWETGMIGQVLYLEAEAQGVRGTGIGCFFDDAVHETLGLRTDAYQSLYHFTIPSPLSSPEMIVALGDWEKTLAFKGRLEWG